MRVSYPCYEINAFPVNFDGRIALSSLVSPAPALFALLDVAGFNFRYNNGVPFPFYRTEGERENEGSR